MVLLINCVSTMMPANEIERYSDDLESWGKSIFGSVAFEKWCSTHYSNCERNVYQQCLTNTVTGNTHQNESIIKVFASCCLAKCRKESESIKSTVFFNQEIKTKNYNSFSIEIMNSPERRFSRLNWKRRNARNIDRRILKGYMIGSKVSFFLSCLQLHFVYNQVPSKSYRNVKKMEEIQQKLMECDRQSREALRTNFYFSCIYFSPLPLGFTSHSVVKYWIFET